MTNFFQNFEGHYLSASALMWASTHNETLKEKMLAVMSALSDCQKKIGSGYLSAFPSDQFDRLENLEFKVWAPYYTMHKVNATTSLSFTRSNELFILFV